MARLILAAALLTMSAGASTAYADEAEVADLAAEAGVPVEDLAGALNSQPGVDGRAYLEFDGLLAARVTPAPAGPWDRLAYCESHGNWSTNTGNGYYGGLQFDLQTWRAYGGTGYPHQASRSTQIAIAENLRAARGYQPWPVCSIRVGLR